MGQEVEVMGNSERPVSYMLSNYLQDYRDLLEGMFAAKKRLCPPGTVFCMDGAENSTIYFLLSGTVKIYTLNAAGYERIIGYHRRNTIFAMGGLIGGISRISSESVTSVDVIPLTEEDLKRIGALRPDFFRDLARYYAVILRLMCFDAENQSNDSVYVRLIYFLELCMQSEEGGQGQVPGLSQEELSSLLNCSRVQLTRVCTQLKEEGVISTQRRRITIEDPRRLIRLVAEEYKK